MNKTSFTPPIAVVDHVNEQFIIWHVNIGPDLGLSRLCGAWILGADQTEVAAKLISDRYLAWADLSRTLPDSTRPVGILHIGHTVNAARSELQSADRLFTEHQATVPHRLVRPVWPALKDPRRPQRLPRTTAEHIVPTLSLAYGIRDLADAWARFEAERIQRKYLVHRGGPTARPLPLEIR
ncbi:hypothetical protein [Nocardia aurantiaca]|uniref:Uncharacterized protein n=1 Tax=Nocardia aurantiaca TaxID=2675850 RepID=A0A6I3L054_9NOCA|nr:hypothetical protein [Nocardia aurantiaca]MTE14140.1 hypothetical protein [Nocardia aurantiaca]